MWCNFDTQCFVFVCFSVTINPDGYSLCPTVSTEIATGTDATANGTTHSNDVANHQESCLWPNALQVISFSLPNKRKNFAFEKYAFGFENDVKLSSKMEYSVADTFFRNDQSNLS